MILCAGERQIRAMIANQHRACLQQSLAQGAKLEVPGALHPQARKSTLTLQSQAPQDGSWFQPSWQQDGTGRREGAVAGRDWADGWLDHCGQVVAVEDLQGG